MSASKPFYQELDDRAALLVRRAAESEIGILVFLEGVNLPAIKDVARHMARIFDPRHFRVLRIPQSRLRAGTLSLLHPYWIALPRYGDMVIHEQSYYHQTAEASLKGKRKARLRSAIDDIQAFESTLSADRYVIIKVFLDRDPKGLKQDYRELKRHVRRLIKDRFETLTKRYPDYSATMVELMNQSDQPHARWMRPAKNTDLRETRSQVLKHFIAVLEERLGVNSAAEVRIFDDAMEERRRQRQGGSDVPA